MSFAILTEPLGASVTVDGVRQEGKTPLSTKFDEGSHEVMVSMPGYLSRRETLVVDSPRGSRLRITLTEGTDVAALTYYFQEKGGMLENPFAGILQCRNIAAGFVDLVSELESYEGDLAEPREYLEQRSAYYREREALLEETLGSLKNILDEQTAKRDTLARRKRGIWTWEIASVTGALAGGAGALLGALRMPEGDPWTAVTIGSAALAAGSLIAAVVLPVKAGKAAEELAETEGRIGTLTGRIARLEAGRAAEAALTEEDQAFVEGRVDLMEAIEEAALAAAAAEQEALRRAQELLEKRGMVLVEGGTFRMGSTAGDDDEEPVHSVTLSSYYISKYEVTQGLWEEMMGGNPAHPDSGTGDNYPVNRVSWYDAVAFCNKLSERDGL